MKGIIEWIAAIILVLWCVITGRELTDEEFERARKLDEDKKEKPA